MTDASGLWSRRLTVRRIVIDPVDVLIDLVAAETALWSWWAGRSGVDPAEAADVGRREPLPRALTRLAAAPAGARTPTDAALAAVRARRAALHRLARRRRGAAALLRSIPSGQVAVWTTLEEEELALLERRARLRLPPARRCALPVDDDEAARRFLAEVGGPPDGWLALESHRAGVARATRVGCRTVVVVPSSGDLPRADASGEGDADLRVEDPGLLSVTPDADGLSVGVRRQARLLPGRGAQA